MQEIKATAEIVLRYFGEQVGISFCTSPDETLLFDIAENKVLIIVAPAIHLEWSDEKFIGQVAVTYMADGGHPKVKMKTPTQTIGV